VNPSSWSLVQGLSYKAAPGSVFSGMRVALRHIPASVLLPAALGLLLTVSLGPVQAQGTVGAPTPAAPPGQQAVPGSNATPAGIEALLHPARASADDFLSVDQAFRFTAFADGSDRVRLGWQIADGYYLYRARIKVTTSATGLQLGPTQFPPAQVKSDPYFGRQEVYHHELLATVPVTRPSGGALDLPLEVSYQGCAEAGLCYPPQTRQVSVRLGAGAAGAAPVVLPAGGAAAGPSAGRGFGTGAQPAFLSPEWFSALLREGNLLVALGWFYLGGLALAFTPCVLPMVPILSGIIVGSGRTVTTGKAFTLSVSYVLGMALTYALAGIASAAAGQQVQALFQQWWVIALFAAIFVALALSMLGAFTVQMPVALQSRLAALSNRQSAGTLGGVALMGSLSALIVTTCVAPVLIGALIVIGQTGAIARGGAALFAAGVGMGTPLLVVGASAGKLLPRPGPWMELVKKVFGALMLAVAVWMLARIVPGRVALALWAVPALLLAWLLWSEVRERSVRVWVLRAVGVAAALYGVALGVGAALGGTDPLAPLPVFAAPAQALPFNPIRSVADLDRELAQARSHRQAVLVDFSADWCTSCKEMERYTFTDPLVHAALANTLLLRADVTRNDADDQALLARFGIFGPPTIAFFGPDGAERASYRVVGYLDAPAFAARARAAATCAVASASGENGSLSAPC
jgi:thioredoxin:protein disulfide reductase